MLITRLTLENFGLFSGVQSFDLTTTKNKHIILIGGKNGNGKTTFFESIRLCLYGPRMMDKTIKKNEYADYLVKRVHHSSNVTSQPKYASVEVEFQHSIMGQVDKYLVKRTWQNNPKNINETFEIKRNDSPLEEFDSDQWQEFINDLIPPGLSQLFFFDGEKIQNLAEDIEDNKQLSESFKSLLGIDLIEKLKSDLDIYSLKELKNTGSKEISEGIDDLEQEEKQLETLIDSTIQERAQLQSNIDYLLTEIEHEEGKLIGEGGGFSKKRDELKKTKAETILRIETIENKLREIVAENFPVMIAKKLNKNLKEQLVLEKEMFDNETVKKEVMQKMSIIKKEISDSFDEKLIKKNQVSLVTNKFLERINELLSSQINSSKKIHNLSVEENDKIINLIDSAPQLQQETEQLIKEHEKLCKIRLQLERELSFAADDEIISKQLNSISLLNKKLGTLNEKLRLKNEEVAELNKSLEKIRREIKKLVLELENKNGMSSRMKLINEVQIVLEEYYGVLKENKLREFSTVFIDSYNTLARKKNVFEKIEVDPKTFNVTLYKQGNREIQKSELSAGEKQIYAISVLWTLTKISNRPLPFIIDTPLGRLDIAHRDNIIFNFLPVASHQIIILSTDTEIDSKYLLSLKKYVAKEFLLNYKNGETKIEEGYFWS